MSLLISIVLIIFVYFDLNRRLKNIEKDQGLGDPVNLTFNIKQGILNSEYMPHLAGIDRDIDDLENWPSEDKNRYRDFINEIVGHFYSIKVTYLPCNKAWIVNYTDQNDDYISYGKIVDRSLGRTIFSEEFGEGEDSDCDYDFLLNIYVRIISVEKKMIPVLTAYLTFPGKSFGDKHNYSHLLDFPYANIDLAKKMGFEVEFYDNPAWPDLETPDFVENSSVNIIFFRKNNVEIVY